MQTDLFRCRNRGGIIAIIVIGSLLAGIALLSAGCWVGGRYRQQVYQQVRTLDNKSCPLALVGPEGCMSSTPLSSRQTCTKAWHRLINDMLSTTFAPLCILVSCRIP